MKTKKSIWHYVVEVLIILLLVIFLIPLIQTFFTALKPDIEIYKKPVSILPHQFTTDHYVHVFTKLAKDFFLFFRNSVVVTSVSVFLIIGLGSLAAFSLARIDFVGKSFVIFFVSLVLSIPLIITVIPIFMMETAMGIKNSNIGLILPYTAVYLPVPLFIMYNNFLKVPTELEESAYIDGASRLQIFMKIFLPLIQGGLIAAGIITFLNCWGEFLYALILNTKRSATTLPIGIMMINDEEQAWALGPMSAVMMLSVIIPMSLYLLFQKNFIKGLMEGSVKG
jgi:ABC-type glycerol-3-phosphate transport system permease component